MSWQLEQGVSGNPTPGPWMLAWARSPFAASAELKNENSP